MKLNKKYKKFLTIENNNYYLLNFNGDLFIGTEAILPLDNRKFFKKYLSQGFKLLELKPPLLILLQELINCEVEKEDEDFKDMTTYKKIDNKLLRKNIEQTYINGVNNTIKEINDEFENWLGQLALDTNMSDEDFKKIETTNRERINAIINEIKSKDPLNSISLKWRKGEDNDLIKRFMEQNVEFLYTQKIGSNYKITYLYELDMFGTITIYKIHLVKDIIKSIETYIYNREVITEMLAYMANNNL